MRINTDSGPDRDASARLVVLATMRRLEPAIKRAARRHEWVTLKELSARHQSLYQALLTEHAQGLQQQ